MGTQMENLDRAIRDYSTLVEFLNWISAHPNLSLAEWSQGGDAIRLRLLPLSRSAQAVVCEFLEIDATALEAERRKLLDTLREEKLR